MHRLRTRRTAGDFGFLDLTLARIGQQVKRITRAHDAGTGQRECHTRGVKRDPAAAPLLGDGGGGAGTAGRVQNEVAGVGRHKHAALNDFGGSLNNINFLFAGKSSISHSQPDII